MNTTIVHRVGREATVSTDPAPSGVDRVDREAERGGGTAVEMALLWVAILLLVLAVVQVALVFYAGQLALTAAQDGVRTGRTPASTAVPGSAGALEAARRDAEAFLARAAGTTLSAPSVTADLDPGTGTVRVTVSGEVLSVVPGVAVRVSRQAVGGLERLTP